MAEVMTDKAAVEVPAPVTGRVVNMNGQPGDMIRVGAELIVFETESNAPPLEDPTAPAAMLGDGPASPAAAEPGETPIVARCCDLGRRCRGQASARRRVDRCSRDDHRPCQSIAGDAAQGA